MNWVSIGIAFILAISTMIGLLLGLTKAALLLAGIAAGVVLGGRYSVAFASKLAFIPQTAAQTFVFVLIVLCTVVVAILLAEGLKWLTSAVILGWVDRAGGAVLGLFFGAVFCGAFLIVGVKFLGISDLVAQSNLAMVMLERFRETFLLIPDHFGTLRSFLQ